MVTVYVSPNESIESALKRFSKKVVDARIIIEVKERQAYEKPSDRRRREMAACRTRVLKKQRKMAKVLEYQALNKFPPRKRFDNRRPENNRRPDQRPQQQQTSQQSQQRHNSIPVQDRPSETSLQSLQDKFKTK